MRLKIGLAAATVALAGLVPSAAQAATPKYYLALGDSLSVGWQPLTSGRGAETNQGYVDRLFSFERRRIRGLRAAKLGCAGETTGTMMRGGICQYRGERRLGYKPGRPKSSQLKAAEAFLRAHRGHVAFVTIDIGANNVDSCANGGTINTTCLNNGIASIKADIPTIAKRLRKAAGSKVTIAGMTLYDPFLALYFDPATRGLATASVGLAGSVNKSISDSFTANGVSKVADVSAAFRTADQTPVTYQGQSVPRDVERICALTWMCVFRPVGPNIHANVVGYRLIGDTFAAVL